MQLFWKDTKGTSPHNNKKTTYGDASLSPGTAGFGADPSRASPGVMYQGFSGDIDSGSRESSSPSIESQYISSVDSFGSPATTSAPQECVPTGGGLSTVAGSGPGGSVGGVEMPGSFVPTVTAITSSQDLQWMVQPTLISSQAPGQSLSAGGPPMTHHGPPVDPYDMPGPSYSTGSSYPSSSAGPQGSTQGPAPGPMRSSRVRSRRARDESLTPEEEEKRRVRRERNKMAAAKCRNRRRELTDRLQSETDVLEEEKSELEAEISELQKEKERLEFVLVAHQPGCKIPYQEQQQQSQQSSVQLPPVQATQQAVSILGLTVKEDDFFLPPAYTPHPASSQAHQHQQHQQHQQQQHLQQQHQQQQQQQLPPPGLMQEVAFSTSFYGSSQQAPGGACHMACDSGGGGGGVPHDGGFNPSYTSSFVFTYPEGACGVSANQRNSSSEQSSDSLNSPSLLAL
ncbi:unnamed protein product [Lota lota]